MPETSPSVWTRITRTLCGKPVTYEEYRAATSTMLKHDPLALVPSSVRGGFTAGI